MTRLSRSALGGLVMLALCTCTRGGSSNVGPAANGTYGYVKMDDLIKVHPLYAQLARFDQDIAALQLKAVGPQVFQAGADVAREEAALRSELAQAANRTRALLKTKQQQYQDRENKAIAAALAASGGARGSSSAGAIANQMQATYGEQAQRVSAVAQANLQQFRGETIAQDRAATETLRLSLEKRATAQYRARADELNAKESALSLSQANADASQRLSLRTKLQNLPLDDSGRKDINDQLAALDRKEADTLAAMRNRDQAELATLQATLRARTRTEFAHESGSIHTHTNAKLAARAKETQSDLVRQLGPINVGTQGAAPGLPPGLSPAMKARLTALHQQYQVSFTKDVDATVKAFLKTRDDLTRRFAELHGADGQAQSGARAEMGRLQKQRADLYVSIVAQVGREVKLVADKHSITVVFSDVLAPVTGVDLTAEAEKDIESLHE